MCLALYPHTMNLGRYTHCSGLVWNVNQHHRIGRYFAMGPQSKPAKNFRTGSDVDMTRYRWGSSFAITQCNLLKNKAVRANHHVWMNHDAVGVWHEEPPPYLGVDRYVCAGHNRPKSVPHHCQLF